MQDKIMNREQYIEMRNTQNAVFIYLWYVEHFKEEKHKILLDIQSFFDFFQMWPPHKEVYNTMLDYWDTHFNVLKVPNKQGQYFMYI